MFNRRMLFKMVAAIGAGSLLPAVGDRGVARFSEIDEVQSFSSPVRPEVSPVTFAEQAVDVSAIEQWENLLDDFDAVELIKRYTSIRPSGDESRDGRGPCPFCRQGIDSLLVDGRDDSYFCTECLAGGHALDFYARMERISLSESVRPVREFLASGELQGKRTRLDRFRSIIEATNRFAQEALVHSREGESARAWLDGQGIASETIEGFSLGVLSYALGKQLLERLLAMGFNSDELEMAGVDGWMSCKKDRVRNGESDLVLLLPVRNAEGQGCGFYEQSIEETADLWSASISPYGFRLLSPHRAGRLVFSVSDGQDSASSVVLAGRPWDVVLFAHGGMEQTAYVSPLDPGEYHDCLDKFLMCTRKAIWPIHSSELDVEFLQNLFRLSRESISRLAFILLSEGETLPAILRREGMAAVQARLAGAVSLNELLRV